MIKIDDKYRASIFTAGTSKGVREASDRAHRALSRRAWIEASPTMIAYLESCGATDAAADVRDETDIIAKEEAEDLRALHAVE